MFDQIFVLFNCDLSDVVHINEEDVIGLAASDWVVINEAIFPNPQDRAEIIKKYKVEANLRDKTQKLEDLLRQFIEPKNYDPVVFDLLLALRQSPSRLNKKLRTFFYADNGIFARVGKVCKDFKLGARMGDISPFKSILLDVTSVHKKPVC